MNNKINAFSYFFYEMFSIVQDIRNPDERERKMAKMKQSFSNFKEQYEKERIASMLLTIYEGNISMLEADVAKLVILNPTLSPLEFKSSNDKFSALCVFLPLITKNFDNLNSLVDEIKKESETEKEQ